MKVSTCLYFRSLGYDDLQPTRDSAKAIQTATVMEIMSSNFENCFVVCKGVFVVHGQMRWRLSPNEGLSV